MKATQFIAVSRRAIKSSNIQNYIAVCCLNPLKVQRISSEKSLTTKNFCQSMTICHVTTKIKTVKTPSMNLLNTNIKNWTKTTTKAVDHLKAWSRRNFWSGTFPKRSLFSQFQRSPRTLICYKKVLHVLSGVPLIGKPFGMYITYVIYWNWGLIYFMKRSILIFLIHISHYYFWKKTNVIAFIFVSQFFIKLKTISLNIIRLLIKKKMFLKFRKNK